MKGKLWQDWGILVAAVWLFFSPFVLDFAAADNPAAWFTWILSAFLVASVLEAIRFTDEIGEWLDIAIGIALVVTPLTLDFRMGLVATLNLVGFGVVIIGCAIAAMIRDRRTGVTFPHQVSNG